MNVEDFEKLLNEYEAELNQAQRNGIRIETVGIIRKKLRRRVGELEEINSKMVGNIS